MFALWSSKGWTWSFTWCGVGSREIPSDIAALLEWVGCCMALLGGVLFTGDAPGSDERFMTGYSKGRRRNMPPAQIYYTRLKNRRGLTHDPLAGYHEAEQYPTHALSKELAFNARGSFEGLFASGIGLHARNPMQVLTHTLEHPVWLIVFYAKPTGKQGRVAGGTNTAVQVARAHGVRSVNLAVDEQREKFITWITDQLNKKGMAVPSME